jgi:heme/copper-type cytochrome/quinol oxidase subunit 2
MKKIFLITTLSIMILLIGCIGFIIYSQFESNINSETSDAITKNIEYTIVGDLTIVTLIVIFALITIAVVLHKKFRGGKNNDMSLL